MLSYWLGMILNTQDLRGHNMNNIESIIKNKNIEKIALQKINAEIDFYSSLVNATKLAGGSLEWITEETTLKDIAIILATNKVRFYYDNSIGN